ncbi:MAG: hypothetical protein QOE25_1209 [Actinomycetota bacterium]|nr:hypothetical protein [Actinomycetota bacterium]
MSDRVKVLYIMSGTRSGSTILDQVLGELDGFFSSGELRFIWERGLLEDRRCGCGEPVRSCEVWSKVLATDVGRGPLGDRSAQEIVDLLRANVRTRHTWKILRARAGDLAIQDPGLAACADVADQLYRAVGEVTGARVIVDSSKNTSDAALLRFLPSVVPYIVHLVRDPRAVVYSWQRKRAEPDKDAGAEMPTWSLPKTTLNWDEVNLAGNAVRRGAGSRAMLLRYHDFVADPQGELRRIAELVGEHPSALPFTGERTLHLSPNHTVSGNPGRFTTGESVLREDDEWIEGQSPSDRRLATALTLPLLPVYGFPLVPGRRD